MAHTMDFEELFALLQSGESDQIEAKKATNGVGKSLLETISAFSNEPFLGGGYLLLGIEEQIDEGRRRFVISGVKDSEKVQNEVASLCRSCFNVDIRPTIKVIPHSKGTVVLVYIPEANSHHKPVYIKSKGIERGAFRRIGASDQLCMMEDLNCIYQQRSGKIYEDKILDTVTWDDIDPDVIKEYRQLRNEVKPNAQELSLDDKELLLSLLVAIEEKGQIVPTVAGVALFGKKKALRRVMPMTTQIDYIKVEGVNWVPSFKDRYISMEFRDPLITMLSNLLNSIMSDIPVAFHLPPGAYIRQDIPVVPRDVIREGLANALMHRDYSVVQPTQIIRYSNRIEFRNAGFSLKPFESMGIPGSKLRNQRIAMVFHELNFSENKGTGMRAMQEKMKEANLSVPLIESDRGSNDFVLTLLTHHLFNEADIKWLSRFKNMNLSNEERRSLLVIREMGAITNADYRMVNNVDTLTASTSLRKLRNLELIKQNGRGSKTYYLPTRNLIEELSPEKLTSQTSSIQEGMQSLTGKEACQVQSEPGGLTPHISPKCGELTPHISPKCVGIGALPKEFSPLSAEIEQEIEKCGKKTSHETIKRLIKILCSLYPLKLSEIANIFDRTPRHLQERYLTSMLKDGELQYLYPDKPNHPKQAYLTSNEH